MGFFTKQPEPRDPVEEFFDAIDALNAAWDNLPHSSKLRPWMDWQNRQIIAVVPFNPERITREMARGPEDERNYQHG